MRVGSVIDLKVNILYTQKEAYSDYCRVSYHLRSSRICGKYLNILPVAKMKDIFKERKWSYEPYLFSIDSKKYMRFMSSQYSHIYFIHEYSHTIYSPFPEVRPIAIKDFLEAHVQYCS